MSDASGPGALSDALRVHFVGIGGAGMSAIAKVLFERGVMVSGSDIKRSRAITMLEAMGADVRIGHDASLVDPSATRAGGRDGSASVPDVVVVSSAIPPSNPELKRARQLGIQVMTRGEALAAVLSGVRSIVVAGAHGKTTTTSMIVSVLRAARRDPTYLVGGGLNDVGANARHGGDDLAVAESDESDGSFLLLSPDIAVVTNVEADHLDHWGSLEAIRRGFAEFLGRVSDDGSIVVPASDPRIVEDARRTGKSVAVFGDGGDVAATAIESHAGGSTFLLHADGRSEVVALSVPGRHNVSNALAAATACLEAGTSLDDVVRGLARFRGVERRFQVRGSARGITVIDDYAHHPTEVRATLAAARPGPWERVVAVFQPHRYSRTAAFYTEFGAAFEDADRVVVTDVYGAGEAPVPGVTGKLVSDAVCARLPGRPVAYLPHRDDLLTYVERSARPGDALLTLGAGDITSVGEELLARLEHSR